MEDRPVVGRAEVVRPGLWSIPVPLPNRYLRYVLVYALESEDGLYLIDAGWNTAEAFAALAAGLASMGGAVTDVRGVLVTHVHPDHYGLAPRVRERSGAWIALHRADAALVRSRYGDASRVSQDLRWLMMRAGAPVELLDGLQQPAVAGASWVTTAEPDVLLEDRSRPEVPGWDLVAVWTPGHSPGHSCFYESRHRLMFTGDHVLPTISPNVSFHRGSDPDPLADFLASLKRIASYDVVETLPAHEHRFRGFQDRVRELLEHHDARLAEVLAVVSRGHRTAWDIAARMRWSQAWNDLDAVARRSAVSETMAHLRALSVRGLLDERGAEPVCWSVTLGRRES